MSKPSRVPEGIVATPPVIAMFELYGPQYVWLSVATSLIGAFSTVLTATIVNVAIPEVMGAYGITQSTAQWLSTGFLAAGTVTMLLGAWFIQVYGMRVTFITAMLIFLAGSIMGGLAPNPEILILSRIITGACAGLISPMAMILNFQIFPVKKRGLAMGLFGVGMVLAPGLGPAIGGMIIEHYNWRYVFYLALPFSMVAIPLAVMFMPRKEETDTKPPPLDKIGIILVSIFLVTLLAALSDGQKEGWDSKYIMGLFGSAFLSGVTFIAWENNVTSPMLNLRLFLNVRFLAAAIVTFVIGIGLYGSIFLIPLFLQTLQGIMPADSGMLLVPAGLAMAVFFPLAGALSDRIQPKTVIILGLIFFAISNWLMREADINTPYAWILISTVIGRIGLALIFPSLNASSLASLPLHQLTQGAGAINFLRQLGGAFGVNYLAITLTSRSIEYSDQFAQNLVPSPATQQLLMGVQDKVFGEHFGFVMDFPTSFAYLSGGIFRQATAMAYREVFLMVTIIMLVSIIPALFIKIDRN
ncbi:MAG: DHA2 family efflux MFS transporter permease subunit [Pseudomonadales bacterium]|nr:DHA2 family efflux MFS transporter permease subunit [Pseudomonadales bacterium]